MARHRPVPPAPPPVRSAACWAAGGTLAAMRAQSDRWCTLRLHIHYFLRPLGGIGGGSSPREHGQCDLACVVNSCLTSVSIEPRRNKKPATLWYNWDLDIHPFFKCVGNHWPLSLPLLINWQHLQAGLDWFCDAKPGNFLPYDDFPQDILYCFQIGKLLQYWSTNL